jgi:hypothetical protein
MDQRLKLAGPWDRNDRIPSGGRTTDHGEPQRYARSFARIVTKTVREADPG